MFASGAVVRTNHLVILVAEEDVGLRCLLWRFLRADGHKVIVTGDGEEALKAARSHAGPINLVVADYDMPHMNGMELCECISNERPGTRSVVISGGAAGREQIRAAGLSFIPKPFTPSAIRAAIEAAFRCQPLPDRMEVGEAA